jgi:hypothetical protein
VDYSDAEVIMFSKKKDFVHLTPEYLDGLIRGLNYVANCASDMSLSHYQNMISQYFIQLEDGSFKAKEIDIRLDDQHVITMPWVAISDGKGLYLDEMDVEFSVKVTGISPVEEQQGLANTAEQVAGELNSAPNLPRFMVTIGQGTASDQHRPKDIIDFKVKFKSQDSPEAVMRVIDKFNSTIHPIRVENGAPEKPEAPEPSFSAQREP